MENKNLGLRLSGIIFGLMALAQLVRAILNPVISINGYSMPLWPSILAFVVLGALALWLFKLARN